MIITSAAVTILLVYFLLCAENYHWQWRAFCGAGASGAYVFANALLYWASRVSLGGFAGNLLYLGYSALISFLFFILTGAFFLLFFFLFPFPSLPRPLSFFVTLFSFLLGFKKKSRCVAKE
jgi:transmembrane 9 superfamily protein 2/4